MLELEQYQDNLIALLKQRSQVSKLSQDKPAKYLPKLDNWIQEVSESIDDILKEVG